MGIYEVDRGFVCTNIYTHDYYPDNNEQIAQRHAQEKFIKG